jgi:hypothetical protein
LQAISHEKAAPNGSRNPVVDCALLEAWRSKLQGHQQGHWNTSSNSTVQCPIIAEKAQDTSFNQSWKTTQAQCSLVAQSRKTSATSLERAQANTMVH